MLSMHEPLKIRITAQFKKDLKTARKQKKPMDRLDRIVSVLQSRGELAPRYKDHSLTGSWDGYRECHIQPDWLLIYRIENDILVLTLSRTGTHSELLDK